MKKLFGIVMFAAIVLLSACVSKGEYDAQVKKVDSLTAVCKAIANNNIALVEELDGYKNDPERVLTQIRENYKEKDYISMKSNLDRLHQYHPEAPEYAIANGIYQQAVKEQAEAKKKAEAARRAKMKPIERIMEKYNCSQEIAEVIHKGCVRIGMTDEQCRAAWGRPRDINRSIGSYGVHEQWCYSSGSYLYMENGILTSIQN